MRLLFITQKIHNQDDDLAFVTLWVREFIKQGIDVQVICLEKGEFDDTFPVYSLGKERGYGKMRRTLNFLWLIFSLDYDRVFVHMNPEYFTVGGWYWFLKRIPSYLWYTHYTMHIHLRLAGLYAKRLFAATPQSLPQFDGNPKKIITGHGIDIDFWIKDGVEGKKDHNKLLSVHRLSRSKRAELAIESLLHLAKDTTLTFYGRAVDPVYFEELQSLVKKRGLENRVSFKGPVPMSELKKVYPHYRVMINMAPETIDKTVLEAMLFGIYPVTTKENAKSIGLPLAPAADTSEAIASFIKKGEWHQYGTEELQKVVQTKHSLNSLVSKLLTYIKPGN